MRRKASILDVLRAAQSEESSEGAPSSEPAQTTKLPAKRNRSRRASKRQRSGQPVTAEAVKKWFLTDLSMPRGGFYLGVVLSLVMFFTAFELGVKRGRNSVLADSVVRDQGKMKGAGELVANKRGEGQGQLKNKKQNGNPQQSKASKNGESGSALVNNPSGSNARQGTREPRKAERVAPESSKHSGPWLQILSLPDDLEGEGRAAAEAVKAHLERLQIDGVTIAKTRSRTRRRGHLILVVPIKAGQTAKTLTAQLRKLPSWRGKKSFNFATMTPLERPSLPK